MNKLPSLIAVLALGVGQVALAGPSVTSSTAGASPTGTPAEIRQTPDEAADISNTDDATSAPDAAAIYRRFSQYRESLSFDTSSPSVYFSRTWNDTLLEWLINYVSDKDVMKTLRVVRNKYRFGRHIEFVHAYSVVALGKDSRMLRMTISSRNDAKQRPIEIQFVMEDGEWRIDNLSWLLSKGAPIGSVVDSFPSVGE